jgi:8-oxo-dGTP pyrophosphatase MutT (NUDIX family)
LLIPAAWHRTALRVAHSLRKVWWQLARPRVEGCRVLAFSPEGHLLLIRHSYGSGQWMPPGGAIDRGETAVQAAVRELREETGCRLTGAAEIAHAVEQLHGAGNHVHIVCGLTHDVPRADQREIIEAQFFALDALPADMPRQLHDEMPGWITESRLAMAG